jgi:hypothetical protein
VPPGQSAIATGAGSAMPAVQAHVGDAPAQRSCKACGYGFLRSAHEPCCSARCADYLAAGGPDKATQIRRDDPFSDRTRFGPVGQFTTCVGCGLTFESRGLRLCPDCYAAMGDPVERKAGCGAERAVRKQVCQGCGGDLPAYSATGRKVRQSVIFCSPACRLRAHRKNGSSETDNRPGRLEIADAPLAATQTRQASPTLSAEPLGPPC